MLFLPAVLVPQYIICTTVSSDLEKESLSVCNFALLPDKEFGGMQKFVWVNTHLCWPNKQCNCINVVASINQQSSIVRRFFKISCP